MVILRIRVAIGITDCENLDYQLVKNHSGAHDFPEQMNEYIARELGREL